MRFATSHVKACALGLLVLSIAACGGGGGGGDDGTTPNPPMQPQPPQPPLPPPPEPPTGETDPLPPLDPTGQQLGQLYAVTNSGRFVTFNRGAAALSTNLPITGLQGSRQVVGMDVRFVDSSVLVLETSGNLYTLEPRTGVATLLATAVSGYGPQVGIELTAGREELRVVGNGVNLVLTGYDEVDGRTPLALAVQSLPAFPNGISEIAGTQNLVACGSPSVLYLLNLDTDQLLVEQTRQGRRRVVPVGSLGLDAEAFSGFEILQNADRSDAAIAVLRVGGVTALYDIDLNTGKATLAGAIPGLRQNERIIGLAAPPQPTSPPARIGNMVAVTASNKLITFDDAAPQTLCQAPTPIVGLSGGEHIVDIDTRPADGRVHALTDAVHLYEISIAPDSFARASRGLSLVADPNDVSAPFSGQINPSFNIDFDPRTGLLTAVDRDLNRLSINVDFGLVTTDAPLTSGPTPVIAYSGSFAPSPDRSRQSSMFVGSLLDDNFSRADLSGSQGLLYLADPITDRSGSKLRTQLIGSGVERRQPIGGDEPVRGLTNITFERARVHGITADNHLITFQPSSPETLDASLPITGLQGSESVLAIDLSVTDDKLFALTNQARLYTLEPQSGQARLAATLSAAPGDDEPFVGLDGGDLDIDFNPDTGELRVVGESGQNLRIDVASGITRTDTRVARFPTFAPQFAGVAYQNQGQPNNPSMLFLFDTVNERLANGIQTNAITTNVRDLGILRAFDTGVSSNGAIDVLDVLGLDFGPDFDQRFVILASADRPAAVYKMNDNLFGDLPNRMVFQGNIALPNPTDQVRGLAVVSNTRLLALLNGRSLISMNAITNAAPTAMITPTVTPITGLPPTEMLLSLELRSSNGRLYTLGSSGAIYTIDATTAAATAIPNLRIVLGGAATKFDIDFNPSDDRLTILDNFARLTFVDVDNRNPSPIPGTNIAYGNAIPAATAYRNNRASTSERIGTAQFLIDLSSGLLHVAGANAASAARFLSQPDVLDGSTAVQGTLLPLGAFQFFGSQAGFDIAGGNDDLVLAALRPSSATQSSLYSIDLQSGRVSLVGTIGPAGTPPVRSLTIRIK